MSFKDSSAEKATLLDAMDAKVHQKPMLDATVLQILKYKITDKN